MNSFASLPKLKFLVFGAGAIGTYVGGSLASIGQKVIFLEKSEIATSLRERGLTIRLPGETRQVPRPEMVSSIEEALTHGPYDMAICAIKSYDTPSLVESLTPYAVALPPLLCLQNGVENETAFASILGEERVIAGSVTTAVGRRGPGDIQVERLRGIGIASDHILSPTLTCLMNSAGLHANMYPVAADMKWSKMLTNLLANASSAILDMPPSAIFSHPKLYALEVRQYREALQVMKALDIKVTDLPQTPVGLLSWAIRSLPIRLSQPILRSALGKGRGAKMPSFHIDLYQGRGKSEVDYLNGAVVRFGERCNIPTPVNRALNETLLSLTRNEVDRSVFRHHPDVLLEKI